MPATPLRADGRSDMDIRPLVLTPAVNIYAEGSAEAKLGRTAVLASATVLPAGLQTAPPTKHINVRCSLLPRATALPPHDHEAKLMQEREVRAIEQICDRALEAAVAAADLRAVILEIECSVVCADGGVACAAVAAGWVALYQALRWTSQQGLLARDLKVTRMAAVSVGLVEGRVMLDLVGAENAASSFRGIAVFDSHKRLVSFDAHSEGNPPAVKSVEELLSTACAHVDPVFKAQELAVLQLP